MAKPTMEQYLTYMKSAPRTLGWGALLVYDRFRTNRLLAQEHIERFNNETWLPPISVRTETEAGSWTDVGGLIFDKPRLSFANSNISSSKARLSMNAIAGTFRELRQQVGSSQVELVSLSEIDPLSGPAVRMNIDLTASDHGSINDEGRVTLDLADPGAYSFEVSSWKELNEKVGQALHREFAGLPAEQRVWELNTLAPVEDELNPTSFAVRTHSLGRAGKAVASADEDELEEGAVLVGVAFNNAAGGNFPVADKSLPYLLPESSADDSFSVNILLANETWMSEVARKVAESPDVKETPQLVIDQSGLFLTIRFGDVPTSVPKFSEDYGEHGRDRWHWRYRLLEHGGFELADPEDGFRLVLEGNKFRFALKGTAKSSIHAVFDLDGVWMKGDRDMKIDFDFAKEYLVELDKSSNKVVLVPGEAIEHLAVEPEHPKGFNLAFGDFVEHQFYPDLQALLTNRFRELTSAIETAAISFDLFRLNGLLFRGDQVVQGDLVQVPGDMSLLGELAPNLTAFAVEPLEAKMLAGSTQAFTLQPEPSGNVQWQARRLPGEVGDAGTFNGSTYTAPSASEFQGSLLRIIVTGTAGGRSSSALVTVVPNSVAVFPFLFHAQYSAPGMPKPYVVVGGRLGAELNWLETPDFKGRLRAVTEADRQNADLDIPKDREVRIYESPEPSTGNLDPFDNRIHIDRIEVTDGVRRAGIDVVIPWVSATATLKAEPAGSNGVRFALWVLDDSVGGFIEVPPEETTWKLVKGEGALNEATGIYTLAQGEHYAIVAALDKMGGRNPAWGFTTVPIPYDQAYEELLAHVRLHSHRRGA
ncbi:hypothetical protein [Pseudomonas sp. NBRC 111127]|uniref:hypothetical protein n=1 Tax=Pseudomonas sp. NBRC 111127 TaxID=1661042 RepID=UPI000A77BBEA|nr:hypothetical protein [Pseudomonas sp. NBRC 111127]